jgi:serine protease Do
MSFVFFRRSIAALLGGLVLILSFAVAEAQISPVPRGPEGIADVIDQVIDSVVIISTSQNIDSGSGAEKQPPPELSPDVPLDQFFDDFFERQQRGESQQREVGAGSGFVIDSAGTIVTNFHVVDGADRVEVVFNDGTKLPAEVVGKDKEIDIAVLKVKPQHPLKPVKFGNPVKLRIGEWFLALGNPFGIGLSATSGIVSGRNRDMRTGKYDNFIQTDASINKGNSGGPLFNLAGEVVGVNTAILSPTGGSVGIGFAVPASTFRPTVAQLLEFGETRRGYIGVRIQDVPEEIAKRLALKDAKGALIAQTVDSGPAAQAGIRKGDVILSFDGKPVTTSRVLQRMVADAGIDREVEALIWREGKQIRTKIRIGRLEEEKEPKAPPSQLPKATGQVLGLDVAPLDAATRKSFKIDETIEKGVVVIAVRPDSPLKDLDIRVGDIIYDIENKIVATPDDMSARFSELKEKGESSASILISDARGEMRYVRVPLN